MEKDVEFFRREYARQKKLENIVNSRVLKRPNVKKWQVTAIFVILPFLIFSVIVGAILAPLLFVYKFLLALFLIVVVLEIYLRLCLILAVKCYQHYAGEEIRRRCKCIPSCSEYALLTLGRVFPLCIALLKIRKRLYKTCDGEEYKVDFPSKKENEKYENSL